MTVHELKTWPEYWNDVYLGKKNFEVRKNDRNYQVGDTLNLKEWDTETESFTGSWIAAKVTYILSDNQFVKDGFVIMGIRMLGGVDNS